MTTGMVTNKFDIYTPELWTPRITRFMRQRMYAAKFFIDYSEDVANADIVHIPHLSDTSGVDGSIAASISVTTGEVTAVEIVETKTDLEVDTWKGGAVFITKFEEREIMKRPSVIDEYSKWLGYRCGRNAEIAILANLTSLTPTSGASTSALEASDIEVAFGILESNSVPKEDCRIFLRPKVYWGHVMNIQKYYDASQFGKATLPYGIHDYLYGIPITLTSNVPDAVSTTAMGVTNAIVHHDAIAFAMFGPDFVAKESEHLRRKLIADVMYGDVILQPTWGVQLISTAA